MILKIKRNELVNARTLRPKIFPLVYTKLETDCQISFVTETWFKPSNELDNTLQDMQHVLGFACIGKDRENGQGGGVVIVYKTGDIVMQKMKSTSLFTFHRALTLIKVTLHLKVSATLLGHVNASTYNSPYFLIGGNFNKHNIENAPSYART